MQFQLIDRFKQMNLKERMSFYNDAFKDENNINYFIRLIKDISENELTALLDSLTSDESEWIKSQLDENKAEVDLETAEKEISACLDKVPALMKEYVEKEVKAQEITEQRHNWMKHENPDILSDQMLGIPMPSPQKAIPDNAVLIDLPAPTEAALNEPDIRTCMAERASRRKFSDKELSLAELSYLLWSMQGIRKEQPNRHYKTVPSGGARQPFETYLSVHNVTGLETGIYRYIPFGHKLLFIKKEDSIKDKLSEYCYGQKFCGYCAVCFFWAVIPYRTEWRYSYVSSKDMLIESGHICQNLYLACESIGAGTCGIAAYDQNKIDDLLELDGKDEFIVYLAPVGYPA